MCNPPQTFGSSFYALSPDGQVAYGVRHTGAGPVFVSWSDATGMVELDPPGVAIPGVTFAGGINSGTFFRGFDSRRGELFVQRDLEGLRIPVSPVGIEVCVESPRHSGGCRAHVRALGSTAVAANDLRLRAVSMPPDAFGIFITGRTIDPVPLTSSAGPLYLGGALGRLVGPGQIQSSGASVEIEVQLDLGALPTYPGPFAAGLPGETWTFQAWFRDPIPGAALSNTSSALAVTVR